MRILLVEDNEDHALITELAIRDAQPELAEQLVVVTVNDGDDEVKGDNAKSTTMEMARFTNVVEMIPRAAMVGT